jgi:RNA polymerase sigma-70 factor, ECF subfamily
VTPGPDNQVRELLAAGDATAAATQAIRTVGPSALRYLHALLSDPDDAKDAFSQWAERVWRGLPAFRGECQLRSWALRLAYHAALDLKTQAWRVHGRRLETGEASRIAETVRTTTAVRRERQHSVFERLRRQLTVEDQTLLELRVNQELSWQEIADVLGRDGDAPQPNTVAKRFQRVKDHLAEMLRSEGIE